MIMVGVLRRLQNAPSSLSMTETSDSSCWTLRGLFALKIGMKSLSKVGGKLKIHSSASSSDKARGIALLYFVGLNVLLQVFDKISDRLHREWSFCHFMRSACASIVGVSECGIEP